MKSPILFATRSALIAFPALFCACGGGSSLTPGVSADPAATPPPVAANAPALALTLQSAKTFRFTWIDVAGETEYRLLEDPDGVSGYTSLTPQPLPADTTAHEHTVFLPARVNARYILQACKGTDCVDSNVVKASDNLVDAIGFGKADAPAGGDAFGHSVAVSDDGGTLAVGAPGEDSDRGGVQEAEDAEAGVSEYSGAVYVFTREGQGWRQQAFLKDDSPAGLAEFGHSLVLDASGDVLAVGVPGAGQGAVQIFRRQAGQWAPWQRLEPSDMGGRFGEALALSARGEVLVVGHPLSRAQLGGTATVFTHDGTNWTQRATLRSAAPDNDDNFGISVAIDGEGRTIAVGASEDNTTTLFGGAVHVFTGTGAAWGTPQRLVAPFEESDLGFGYTVALSRDGFTLAVGAAHDGSAATGIDGDPRIGGAPGSGAVHVFSRTDAASHWGHQAYLKASNAEQDDAFGRRGLALSAQGDTLAVGAPYERSRADGLDGDQGHNGLSDVGAVYVFRRQGTTWRQQAYVKASNSDTDDEFGWGLALAAEGHTLAVGAPGENSSGGGWQPAQNDVSGLAGAVYLY
jgi:hypothetical protein